MILKSGLKLIFQGIVLVRIEFVFKPDIIKLADTVVWGFQRKELKETWHINGFMFFIEELMGLSVSSGMNTKVTYNFYLPEQESPGIVKSF